MSNFKTQSKPNPTPYAGELVWRQSQNHWTGYRSDFTKFKPKLLRNPPTWNLEPTVRFFLGLGGKRVSIHYDEKPEIVEKLLKKGKVIRMRGFKLERGAPNECHHNSGKLWKKNPELKLVRGYGLFSNGWNDHTWLLDKDGTLIETTIRASIYFGVVLTKRATREFVQKQLSQ